MTPHTASGGHAAPRSARGPIVTADDLGLRADVDAGVVRAHREGIVTHASWLAGGETACEAAALVSRDALGLGIGLHLALSQVRPSGPEGPLAALLTPEARFPGQRRAFLWSLRRKKAVWREWNAQADAFERVWGRAPAHLDSHQHVHLAPWLGPLAVRLAVERGIPRLRAPREGGAGVQTRAFSALGRRLAQTARAAGLETPDAFRGFAVSGTLTLDDLRTWAGAGADGEEWMCHPGLRDEPDGYRRRQELEALVAARGLWRGAGDPPEAP